jgi:hypothetical protein
MRGRLTDFVFTGILASHCVRDLQAQGLLRSPLANAEERRDHDFFAPVPEAIRGGSIQMQRWYRMLFVFENLAREFLIKRFTELDGETWFETRASQPMKKHVEGRQKAEENNQWYIGRNRAPIYHLEFGHLALLITNHWAAFEDFFPDQAWVVSRLNDAERSRNVIAHTNLISAEEGARLEMYLRDFMRQIA